ncbi:MAG: esterase family protein [Clostridiales bacterium]|nr:esterase family protein [Clostridiales bacterium]
MACFQGNIYSKALSMETQLYVSMPQDGRRYAATELPRVLILLHGVSDNASGWARRSQADYFADKYGIAVFIPEVQRSFYQDMRYGGAYYTYISDELPNLIKTMFLVSHRREDWTVAGLSMGGYGSMRVAFGRSDIFGYCGAFSAGCDIRWIVENREIMNGTGDIGNNFPNELAATIGTDYQLPEDSDLYQLVSKVAKAEAKPALYLACGTEDIIYQMNVKFKNFCQTLPLDFKYEEWPGVHDWDFWNVALERMLKHFLGEPQKLEMNGFPTESKEA